MAVDFEKRPYLLFQLVNRDRKMVAGFHPSRGFHNPDDGFSELVQNKKELGTKAYLGCQQKF